MFITNIDHYIFSKIPTLHSDWISQIIGQITWLGSAELVVFFTAIVLFLFWKYKQKNYARGLLVTIALAGFTNWLLKHIFLRPRPPNGLVIENSYSFPSGHATLAMALYGFCAYYFWKTSDNKIKKIFFLIFNILLILFIGFTRLYLGVHYLSDIIGGYLLGALCLMAGIYIAKRK